MQHLQLGFQLLQDNKLVAKCSKCSFGCTHIEYLRYIILAEGVSTDLAKIAAVRDWPILANVKILP